MPRRAFLRDVEVAAQASSFSNISTVRAEEDDGLVSFNYHSDALPSGKITIDVLVTVDEYPDAHTCYLCTTSQPENVPPVVGAALQSLQTSLTGFTVSRILGEVSSTIGAILSTGQEYNPIDIDDGDEPSEDDFDNQVLSEDDDVEDEQLWSPKSPTHQHSAPPHTTGFGDSSKNVPDKKLRQRLRSDLRAAKRAGFKVGTLGDLSAGGFVCVSIRVVKLGISEEAMQAWGLRRKLYLVLLMRFENGYKTIDQVSEENAQLGRNKTEMRVALSEMYKPSITDAINAFALAPQSNESQSFNAATNNTAEGSTLEPLFIGVPLNDLLRERFSGITKYRLACGFSWTGAEMFFNDIQGKSLSAVNPADNKYNIEDDNGSRALPRIAIADHVLENVSGRNLSLPLIAMQFIVRHFVRCTEFCLVCHCKIETSFEALKPYVCSKPLCLYQFLNLGFGPSIEWEILSQPNVVDLLVSFCYVAAYHGRLREFPVGIDLTVPDLPQLADFNQSSDPYRYQRPSNVSPSTKSTDQASSGSATRLDAQKWELVAGDYTGPCPLKKGDWLVIDCKNLEAQTHTRVEDTSLWPVVKLGQKIRPSKSATVDPYSVAPATTPVHTPRPMPAGLLEANYYVYDQGFDHLSDVKKQNGITLLLDTLPKVQEMKEFLERKSYGREAKLKDWRHRISDSALNLLRWIIASNRSCIMQVDKDASRLSKSPTAGSVSASANQSHSDSEDRVSGMDDWMQFRFAQGAPDKEQRFIDCVKDSSSGNNEKHPTLFAWHGSPLSNWHSIVRVGLDFKETAHGRAFGNGVYMSPQVQTSLGYSNMFGGYNGSGSTVWPNSALNISCAVSLNEVVNAPEKFTSRTPHYVVDKIEWIQTRYLFVKSTHRATGVTSTHSSRGAVPAQAYEQDPQAFAMGDNGQAVVIPITAVSKSRRPVVVPSQQNTVLTKKSKTFKATNQQKAEEEEDDAASLVTEEGDSLLLLSSDEDEPMPLVKESLRVTINSKKRGAEASETDFVADSLDFTKLKLLQPPKDASSSTSKALMKHLQDTLKAQRNTPAHELGWYVHGDKVENVYQWIVEMHSFDPKLLLAQDMKKEKVTSIVLELRFTNSFPYSPPFVRVIKPRFLPFASGGGGNVTAGGALCMELLTNTGWLLSTSIESVLFQVRFAMSDRERPARLQSGSGDQSYGVYEAVEAYKRACRAHGWEPPKDFDSLQETDEEISGLHPGSGRRW